MSVEDLEAHSGVTIISHHVRFMKCAYLANSLPRLQTLQPAGTRYDEEENLLGEDSVEGKNRIVLFGTLEGVMKGSQKQHVYRGITVVVSSTTSDNQPPSHA